MMNDELNVIFFTWCLHLFYNSFSFLESNDFFIVILFSLRIIFFHCISLIFRGQDFRCQKTINNQPFSLLKKSSLGNLKECCHIRKVNLMTLRVNTPTAKVIQVINNNFSDTYLKNVGNIAIIKLFLIINFYISKQVWQRKRSSLLYSPENSPSVSLGIILPQMSHEEGSWSAVPCHVAELNKFSLY